MCDAPRKLADGTLVACQECKPCLDAIRDNWVGKNLAERQSRKFAYVITATYGRGRVGEILHERAVILTYSDCQKFLKLLRRHGYDVRYFITGEYGSERGRAHWNIILYSDHPLPAFAGWDQFGRWTSKARFKQRFNWVRTNERGEPVYVKGKPAFWWPHGFVHIDEVNLKSVRYCCKYVTKDLDENGKQGKWGFSKFPPLGTEYFRHLAEQYVEQGLAPTSQEYRFTGINRKNGKPVTFWLKGRSMELMLDHYLAKWAEKHPDREHPKSDLLDRYELYGEERQPGQKLIKYPLKAEARMQFPKGESRERIPSGVELKAMAQAVREHKEFEAARRAFDERMEWWNEWSLEADGEERQRRQKIVVREREREAREFNDKWFHSKGLVWKPGKGWCKPASGEEPCCCGYCGSSESEPKPDAAKPDHSNQRYAQEFDTDPFIRWEQRNTGCLGGY